MPFSYTEREQTLIYNLIIYFQQEKKAGKPLLPLNSVLNRVSDALKVPLRTVERLSSKGVGIKNAGFQSPETSRSTTETAETRTRRRKNTMIQIHQNVVRNRVYAMYSAGENVTVSSLQNQLQSIDGITVSTSTVYNILKQLKFVFRQCSISNRKYLMEQPVITHRRLEFLREYTKNKTSPISLKPVVLDETWIFSKGAFRRSWQDDTLNTVRKKSGEGSRYIILHAGNENGFISNASLIFKSGSKSGDYHDAMNGTNFEKWFENQLLPNLEEPSLIIMDNATYHSQLVEKIPNKSWSKKNLVEWLIQKHIPDKRYKIDELALKYGHRVLRLPPYHCQYNPIEQVWSECKRYYDSKITSITAVTHNSVLNLWQEALDQVTHEKWKAYFGHANKIIEKDWDHEKLIDAANIHPIVITDNTLESSTDEEFFSDEEDETLGDTCNTD